MDLSYLVGLLEARPSLARNAFGTAMDNAELVLILYGPWGLPEVCAARSLPTPRRPKSLYCVFQYHVIGGSTRLTPQTHGELLEDFLKRGNIDKLPGSVEARAL